MNGVEGGLSQTELDEQARVEWISRGFPVEDFTYKAMQQVWKQEEKSKVAEEEGANRFAEKQAQIQRNKDNSMLPSKKQVTQVISDTYSSVKVNAKATAHRLARSLELPFMRRARLQREHLERVLQQHSKADGLHSKKEDARRTRRLERIHELDMDRKNRLAVTGGAPFRAHLRELEDAAKKNDRDLRDQAKKESRQAYIDGIHLQQQQRREQMEDRKQASLRRSRAKANREYKLKSISTRQEHELRRDTFANERSMLSKKKKDDFIKEQKDYKLNLVTEEMSFPKVSTASAGGIFGTPNEPGSYFRDGNQHDGQDDYTINGGSILTGGAPTGTAFEERQGLLFDLQGKQGQLQDKYDNLRRLQLNAEDETSTLEERIQKSKQDIKQSDTEQSDFETELDGVGRKHAGRRFAYNSERKTIHDRKRRRETLVKHTRSLEKRQLDLKHSIKKWSREELMVARDLAVIRSEVNFAEQSQAREYAERPQLPMVIGRQLNQVKGIREQIAASRDTIRETLIGSKFEILKNESKAALIRAKAMHKMNHQEWKSIVRHRDLKVEVELGESQLHAVVGRLKEVMKKQQSTDLQGAVQKWWQNQAEAVANYKSSLPKDDETTMTIGGKTSIDDSIREKALALGGLRKVNIVHEGWIDWWSLRDSSQTAGIDQFQVENVQLGNATFGVIQGRIVFPKHGVWKLNFTVTKADELSASSGDPNDFVIVRMGTSAMSMALVGKYHNVRAPGEPGVRYQIEKDVTGQKISFRFELASSSDNVETHMMVTRGRFKQMKPPPLEQIGDDPKHVLSSYVKMQRIEEKQGKARGAILLTELIKVERLGEDKLKSGDDTKTNDGSTSPKIQSPLRHTWFDTKVVNGFEQRFDRQHLARFLRDELKREMGQNRKDHEKQQEAADAIRNSRPNTREGGEDKHEESERQKIIRERDRAKRLEEKEIKKKNKTNSNGGNGSNQKDGGGSSSNSGNSDVKKWPRFGTKEDGHDEDNDDQGVADGEKVKSIVSKLFQEKQDEGGGEWNPDGPSTMDEPPDLFAAGLDDENGSTPFNTDVLRRPAERDLLNAMKQIRKKREMRAKKKKLTEKERKKKEIIIQDKLDKSLRKYLLRKRCGVEVDMEQARELVGQRLEIYFASEARWRLGTVIDMRTESSDGGNQVDVLHAVKYYGAEGAPTIWENMSSKRFVVLKSDLASVEARRMAMEEKRRLRNEKERRQREEFERNERIKLEESEEDRRIEGEEMRSEMREDIAQAILIAGREAEFIAETKAMDRFFEDQVPKITEEQKQGIGTEDGFGIFIVPKVAKNIAKKRFIQGSINVARREVRDKWSTIWNNKREVVEKEREHEAKMAASRWRAERSRQEEETKQHREQVLLERQSRKKRLVIPNFELANPPITRCEHQNVKFWGTKYARGLKCKDCNIELTRSHEDNSQVCSVNAEIEQAIQWHRLHEHGSFRPKSHQQMIIIDNERLRIEKTRRELYLQERGFYDLPMQEGVQLLYQMHMPDIVNDAKILSDLLLQLTGSMAAGSMDAGQMLKLATSTEFGSSDILTRDKADIADVVIASQPQTFMGGRLVNPSRERDWDNRRRSAYKDLLTYYARLNVFEMTLQKLLKERRMQLSHRNQYTRRLKELHAELVVFEDRMILVQDEHDRCEQMLKVRAVAQKKHDEAVSQLFDAQGGYDEAVETRTTTEMAASLTEREHAELLNQVREMLIWRKWSTDQVIENKELMNESLEELTISKSIVQKAYDIPEKLNLCRRGEVLYLSKWGKTKVVSFRPATDEDEKNNKPKGSFEQRAAAEAIRLKEEKEMDEQKAEEERIEQEKNDPDFLFKWLCQFCGRKNGRHDKRCKGCETKKPLRLQKEEDKWLDERKKKREEEERLLQEEENVRLKAIEDELAKDDNDRDGAWECKICGCNNSFKAVACNDCGRLGRPDVEKSQEDIEREDRIRRERAKKLIEPMPATLVMNLTTLGGPLAKNVWKLYTPLDPVVEEYRALRVAENEAMSVEDALVRPIYIEERIVAKENTAIMLVEDDLMRYLNKWEKWDETAEQERVDAFRRASEEAGTMLLGLPDVKMQLKETLEFRIADAIRKRDAEIKEWDGHGKKPTQYDRLGKWKLKKELKKIVSTEFCEEHAKTAEREIIHKWKTKEIALREDEQSWEIMLELVQEFAIEIGQDSFKGSMSARERAETDSGVVFSEIGPYPLLLNGDDNEECNPNEMKKHLLFAQLEVDIHHAVYMRLLRLQNARRAELREALDFWGQSMKDMLVEEEPEETEEQRIARELIEAEREKERLEREQMFKMEMESKQFYLDELKLCLRERWRMRDEEAIIVALMKEEEEMNQTSKYDVAGSEPKKKTKSTKERRREQLKKRNAERNRIKREMEEMIEEDVLGSAMQQDDMRKRQQEAMKDENMDSDGSDESSGNESDYDNLEEIESEDSDGSLWDSTDEDEEDESTPLGTPLSRSLRYYDVSVREIKEQMRTDRRAARKIKKKIKIKRKKGKSPTSSERNKLERKIELLKNSIDLSIAMQRAVMEASHAELSLIRNENNYYLSRKRLFRANENSRRIGLHSRKRNNEEQKLRRIARDQRGLADEAASIADEKEQIVNDLVPVVRKLGRERKKVEAGTLYMDTVVLHGQPQRFKTDELYQKLHWFYFYLLSQTIADRSELCVLERRLMHMQYILSQGTVVVKEKKVLVKKMRVEKARFDRMRLRKSILGKEQMFGKSQYRAISFAFNAWRAWWRGHVGTKRAFILKQGLIKHEYDLKRVGRERREAKRRKEHGMASYTDDDQGHPSWKDNVGDWRRIRREKRAALGLWNPKEDDSVVGGGGAVREEVPVSIMKRHQRRWLECKMCKIRYREGQNHQRACQYHSGVYKLACPKSCPFALTKPHSVKCLAHYRTRWSCCESLAEGEYGSTGCDYRWHATSGVDIPYRAQHEQHKEEEDRAEEQLQVVKNDASEWERKARRFRIEGIKDIIEERNVQHEDASRFKDIKWA